MAAANLDTPVVRLPWFSPLAASDNPWDLLATGVFAADRRTYRWAEPARRFRDQLVPAVRTVIERESSNAAQGGDADDHEQPVKRVS